MEVVIYPGFRLGYSDLMENGLVIGRTILSSNGLEPVEEVRGSMDTLLEVEREGRHLDYGQTDG